MNTEEKAKAYDEALERARKMLDMILNNELLGFPVQIREIFPQLTESEDERIRKEMIDFLKSEKAFQTIDMPKSERWIAWLEKQKEQDNEEGDFTIYHPQKNGEGKYKCIPFSFYGSLTSFSNDKDLMDFLNECFYDKEECERWCEIENKPELPECKHKIKKDSVFDYLCESSDDKKKKEQKPAQTSEEKEYIRTLKSLISDFIRDNYKTTDISFYQKIYDWLDGRHIEPEPVKRSIEDDHIIGFVYDLLNEIEWKDSWAMSKDECLRLLSNYIPEKPAEWSEEDEKMIERLIRHTQKEFDELCNDRYGHQEIISDLKESCRERMNWLENRLKSLRPSWKPSEEHFQGLRRAILKADTGSDAERTLKELYEQIKKLM